MTRGASMLFSRAGLALETDIFQNDWPMKKTHPDAIGIFGADVTGWSVIFGSRFQAAVPPQIHSQRKHLE